MGASPGSSFAPSRAPSSSEASGQSEYYHKDNGGGFNLEQEPLARPESTNNALLPGNHSQTVLKQTLELPQMICADILKRFHYLTYGQYQHEIANMMLLLSYTEGTTRVRTFSDEMIRDVLFNPSHNFQLVGHAILSNDLSEFESILRKNPEVLYENNRNQGNLVAFAISHLSLETPGGLNFLQYVLDEKNDLIAPLLKLRADKLEVVLIAEKLLQLEEKMRHSSENHLFQKFYQRVLHVTQKIACLRPSALSRGERNLDFFPILARIESQQMRDALLPGNAYFNPHHMQTYSSLSDWKSMVTNWQERRASKIAKVNKLFHDLQSAHVSQIECLLKDPIARNLRELLDTQDEEGLTMSVHAARNGNISLLKALIRAKARLDLVGQSKLSPLHWILMKHDSGFEEAVEALVAAGIDVNAESDAYGTPLYIAAQNGLAKEVEYLVAAGAWVGSHPGELKYFPCVGAARNGHTGVLEFLVSCGADINARSVYTRSSALNQAVKNGHLEVVRILLAAGAQPDLADCTGLLPTHAAVAKTLLEEGRLLEVAGGGKILLRCETKRVGQRPSVLPSREKGDL